jgi:aromatase
MSATFTLDDLRQLLRDAVGVDESVDFDGDIMDTEFVELGYDSLAVLEVAALVGRTYSIRVPDEDVEGLTTPRLMIDYVNQRTGAQPAAGARTESSVVIKAPLDLVWDMTNDVESWPELFSEYAKVEILAREGDRVRFRLHTRPDENGKSWDWVSERVTDRASNTVRAERVSPGPFEYMRLLWTYEPVDDGVLMRWVQEFHLRPEAPVNDEFMANRITKNSAHEMDRIRQLVEQAASEREPVR